MEYNCRGCFKHLSEEVNAGCISLFAQYKNQYCLSTIILNSVGLKVDKNDGASKIICVTCADKLVDIHNFRAMYIESDQRFQMMLKQTPDMTQPSVTNDAKSPFFENDSTLSLTEADDILTEALTNVFGWDSFSVAEESVVDVENQGTLEAELEKHIFDLELLSKNQEDDQSLPTRGEENEHILNDLTKHITYNKLHQISKIDTTSEINDSQQFFESSDDTDQSFISSGRLSPTSSGWRSPTLIYSQNLRRYDPESSCSTDSQAVTSTESSRDFPSTSSLQSSKKKKNGNHLCEKCEMVFSTFDHLKRHTFTHNNEQTQCPHCPKAFAHKSNLTRHLALHVREKKFTCDQCCRSFTKSDGLCDHLKAHSSDGLADEPTKGAQNCLLECETCTFRSLSYAAFINHMRNNHPEIEIKKVFRCHQCGERFSTKQGLFRHIDSIHDNNRLNLRNQKKNFLCITCGKSFFSNVQLIVHERTHNGEKPFNCKFCTKSFAQISGLKMHTYTHTGERPFVCRICEKSFTQPNHLKEHLLVHEGIKPHVCSICDHSFRVKGNLTAHMMTHGGAQKFNCDKCEKSFPKRSKWLAHTKDCSHVL